MRFVTELAIRRRVVTVLSIALLLAFGVFTYRNMPVELFPEIEFPLITVTAIYPSAGPDAVVRDVTAPIETAMLGIDGIDSVQSVSSGFLAVVSGSFEFGTDMAKAEQALNASLDAIDFPSTVDPPNAARVTPDAFPVLLENLYRHIQGGRERWRAALQATVEVGPAITASTLTTIAVFVPLIFLEGLVGSFFFPFAIAVSFALVASLVVAMTAIPVLGAYLLRPSDERVSLSDEEDLVERESWMQRAYAPVLRWALSHKAVTVAVAVAVVAASLALIPLIPVTLFPSGGDRIVRIEMVMAPGTSIEGTVQEAAKVERQVGGLATIYATQIGSPTGRVGGSPGGFDRATILLQLEDDAPEDTAAQIREQLEGVPGRTISVNELSAGLPQSGLEVTITGADYDDISSVALELADRLRALEGLVNVSDDTAEESEEIIFDVDPAKAAGLGLTAQTMAFQVRQHLAGQSVATLNLDGDEVDVVLIGRPGGVADVDSLKRLTIAGPAGAAPLGQIASVTVARAPASVTRTDGLRSARIVAENTQAMGRLVQQEIDALIEGGRTRLRPILMTAITTSFALLPLAAFVSHAGGIISAELATVVIGGLITSTAFTLIVVPVVYMLVNETIPGLFSRGSRKPAPVEAS